MTRRSFLIRSTAAFALGAMTASLAFASGSRVRFLDVKDFGAKIDGHTDDSGAVLRAVDACRKSGVRTVYMPAGTYRLNRALMIGDRP